MIDVRSEWWGREANVARAAVAISMLVPVLMFTDADWLGLSKYTMDEVRGLHDPVIWPTSWAFMIWSVTGVLQLSAVAAFFVAPKSYTTLRECVFITAYPTVLFYAFSGCWVLLYRNNHIVASTTFSLLSALATLWGFHAAHRVIEDNEDFLKRQVLSDGARVCLMQPPKTRAAGAISTIQDGRDSFTALHYAGTHRTTMWFARIIVLFRQGIISGWLACVTFVIGVMPYGHYLQDHICLVPLLLALPALFAHYSIRRYKCTHIALGVMWAIFTCLMQTSSTSLFYILMAFLVEILFYSVWIMSEPDSPW